MKLSTKICNVCEVEKPLELFRKDSRLKSGRAARCKTCQCLYTKSYTEKNKEKVKKYNKEYRFLNSEIAKLRSKKWREDNPEKEIQMKKTYYSKNREKIYVRNAEKRAMRTSLTPPWANKVKILEIYKLCKKISEDTGVKHHVDHIIPLKGKLVSGFHVEYNLRIIPAIDNLKKGNRLL